MDQEKLIGLLRLPVAEASERTVVCPDDQQIAAYVDGELENQARVLFEQHLADCDLCIGRVGFLSRLRDTEPAERVPELLLARARRLGTAPRHAETQHGRYWAAAAAMVLAVTGVLYSNSMLEVPLPDSQVPSSRTSPSLMEGALVPRVLSPSDGSTVDPNRVIFSWTDVPGSLYYDLHIVNDEGDLVWQERVADTHWGPRADMQLSPGAEYFVRVDAYLAEAKTLSSDHVVFKVSKP